MKKICYIVGAGHGFADISKFDGDLVIAADGGYRAVVDMGISPDVLIGDMDSLDACVEGVETVRLPTVKDDTDTLYALRYAYNLGYRNFVLMGATGGRLAHTVANVQSLTSLHDVNALIIGEEEIVRVVEDGELALDSKHRGYISVFALTADAVVTLRGLKYSLMDYTMTADYPIGVSNEFVGAESLVAVKGRVLVIYDRDTHSDACAIDGLRG